jgi:hydroxyacylglutathione hydrolase
MTFEVYEMLQIQQFRYAHDNLAYLIHGRTSALAIDGGASGEIRSFLENRRLKLLYVLNTHDHADHTAGNSALLETMQAIMLTNGDLPDGYELDLEGHVIRVLHTPGHTEDSKCFHAGNALISGDTLFNGTIGNCFSGNLRGFYLSIKKLMALPAETIIYAGHDYVRDSMVFAKYLEPGNEHIQLFLGRYNPAHVFSTLTDEFQINPYFRFNEDGIVAFLKQRGLPVDTEWDRWQSLMRIE